MKTPISRLPEPPAPATGRQPTVYAIGSVTGATTRSYGRTHSAPAAPASTKQTPYTVGEPPASSRSRKAMTSSASVVSSAQPRPVSLAAGSLRTSAASGPGSTRRAPAR
ncbi:hypothetical protein GCM10010361_75600 [Streptomyces olivaceiscleroticus]|uniref:Uncharacterized protein n=1 Tax=Streptomyces olivaceiscleroticus TaxID=68245 RepID=A0ABN1BJK1_9ACTN